MIFDFDKFAQITESVYPQTPYTLEESLSVFRYYFEKYEEYTGRPHPPIRASQIVRVCQDMPFISREYSGGLYADSLDFDTVKVDYTTSMSGRIAKAANRKSGDEMRPIVIDFTAQLDGKTLVRQMVPIMRNEARAMGV